LTRLYLADKSALGQRHHSQAAHILLALLLSEGALASCHLVALEVLYSARNRKDYEKLCEDIDTLPWLPCDEQAMDRAMEVQHLLSRRGQHRLPLHDLMIAATAAFPDRADPLGIEHRNVVRELRQAGGRRGSAQHRTAATPEGGSNVIINLHRSG
jgi:predicted nucleic acid-binding protein